MFSILLFCYENDSKDFKSFFSASAGCLNVSNRVADMPHFNADPDPAFHSNTDPNSTSKNNANPDPQPLLEIKGIIRMNDIEKLMRQLIRDCSFPLCIQECSGSGTFWYGSESGWIRIRLLLSSCKNSKKNLDSYYFVTLFDFLSSKKDVNVSSKSIKQKK